MRRYYLAAVILVVLATVTIITQSLVAAPARRDQDRSDDLTKLETSIAETISARNEMPASLASLTSIESLARPLSDYSLRNVEVGAYDQYGSAQVKYDLCATFETRTGTGAYDFSNHPAGAHCFDQTAQLSR